jgi:hypothetical protein
VAIIIEKLPITKQKKEPASTGKGMNIKPVVELTRRKFGKVGYFVKHV